MVRNALYRRLCTPETLQLGWHLAHSASRDDFFRDAVGYADFAASLKERIKYLLPDLESGRFRPRHLVEVDVPKSGLSVRPGHVLPIAEAMVLHAVVFLIAPKLDKTLSEQVFSYRLVEDWDRAAAKGKSIFREAEHQLPFLKGSTIRQFDPLDSWYTAWPDFDKARRDAVSTHGFTHLTRTDITAYFENIDLRILENLLREKIPTEPQLIQLLIRTLEAWTRRTSGGTPVGRGIPQGNPVSSFLGNLYLIPLDHALTGFSGKKSAMWFRYVDDVEVYTRSAEDAREVVFVINESLRALHLNLQGSKTEILSGTELAAERLDPDQDVIDEVDDQLRWLDCKDKANSIAVTTHLKRLRPIARRFRTRLPGSVLKLSKKDNRKVRRLMTCYGRTGRPYLKSVALACLRELPELRMLDKSLRYLSQLDYSLHQPLADSLLEMLEAGVFPLPYQAARVIEQIGLLHPDDSRAIPSRLRRYALARKHEWTVRQKAGEALSVYPYREDHAVSVASGLLCDPEPWVRRAGLVLLVRGPVSVVRSRVHELIYHPDPPLSDLALYYDRHLRDEEFVRSQLVSLRKSNQSDFTRSKQMARCWLISCHESPQIVAQLRHYVQSIESKSSRIKWHRDALVKRTGWVDGSGDA